MQIIYCADAEDVLAQRKLLISCGGIEGEDFVLRQLDEMHEAEIRGLLFEMGVCDAA